MGDPATVLDRAIGWLAPRWGAERAYWRATMEMARAYEAARTGRRTSGWDRSSGSANAELSMGAANIRKSTRALVRNNPWATVAVAQLAAKIVGTGIIPRPVTTDDALRTRYTDQWQRFCDGSDPEGQIDFNGQSLLAARTLAESGEVLLRFLPRPSSWRLDVPLQIQVMEPDWLDTSRTQRLEDGGADIQGVRYDRHGRRTGYWLFDEHPGEVIPVSVRGSFMSTLVPASEILHVFQPLRPGQARGVSMFAPVAIRLHDIDDFADAHRVGKKIAACFAAFVKRAPGVSSPLSKSSTEEGTGRRLERLSPGLVQYLQPGEEVTFGTPPSAGGEVEYMNMELHAVAAGVGITYEMMTGDLSQVSFASYRCGKNDFYDLLDVHQWIVMIPQLHRRVWQRLDRLLVAMGERRQAGMPAEWSPPRRRLQDPGKEFTAYRDAMRSGIMTPPQVIAEMGYDPVAQLEELRKWNELVDAHGIVLDSDPRKTRPATTAAPQPDTVPAKE